MSVRLCRSSGPALVSGRVLGLSLALVAGCGGASKEPVNALSEVSGLPDDDQSRCAFANRPDREVSETKGPSAQFASVRRVFGIMGEGDDRRRILLCREADTNLDGVKDVVRTYNDRGEALNELADSDYDGNIDTWITFSRGRMSKLQVDNGRRGAPDETRLYVAGKLSRAQRDTNYDGKPDVWEIYSEGKLQRLGVDLDFDGHVDRWDRDEILMRELNERERREAEAAERAKPVTVPDEGAYPVASPSGSAAVPASSASPAAAPPVPAGSPPPTAPAAPPAKKP
jgi:hypothetical protein